MTIDFGDRLGMVIAGGAILFALIFGLGIAYGMEDLEPIFERRLFSSDEKRFNRSCLGWLITSSVIAYRDHDEDLLIDLVKNPKTYLRILQ